MIKIRSSYPPALFTANGKTYVLPVWQEVPNGTTLDSIVWEKVLPKSMVPTKPTVDRVKSSDGKRIYLVTTYGDGRKTCTCPGFHYRRFCKHTGAK